MIKSISTYWNCERYLANHIKSIQMQDNKNFVSYLVNDNSKDFSYANALQLTQHDPRFVNIKRDTNFYQAYNHYDIIHNYCDDEDIIISLDGDDLLPDINVFNRIQKEYDDNKDLWLTYGSYKYLDGRPGIAQQIYSYNTVRQDQWKGTHLKTWKAWLFKHICMIDMMDKEGKPVAQTGDMCMMFPMLEMAGEQHCKYLPEINYVYNHLNPMSDHIKDRDSQYEYELFFRSKPSYARI